MQILYLIFAIISSGYSGVCYKKISSSSLTARHSAVLPVLWLLPLSAFFGIWALADGGIDFSAAIILPALLGAVSIVICFFSLLESMKMNSYSISMMIVNLGFIFPVLMSVVFLKEKAHPVQLAGMVVAAVVVILNSGGKKDGEKKGFAAAILAAVGASLGNGLVDFAIKLRMHADTGQGETSFFFFEYLFACVICAAAWLVFRIAGKDTGVPPEHKKELYANAALLALCNGVCFFFIGRLAGLMNAATEFTVITSGSIILSLLFGTVRMNEKIKKREALSLVFCAVAILCQYLNLV